VLWNDRCVRMPPYTSAHILDCQATLAYHHREEAGDEVIMSSITISSIIFALVFGGALFGMFLRAVLPEQHLGADSKELVRLGMALVSTEIQSRGRGSSSSITASFLWPFPLACCRCCGCKSPGGNCGMLFGGLLQSGPCRSMMTFTGGCCAWLS
jgi:hypothetical protein